MSIRCSFSEKCKITDKLMENLQFQINNKIFKPFKTCVKI